MIGERPHWSTHRRAPEWVADAIGRVALLAAFVALVAGVSAIVTSAVWVLGFANQVAWFLVLHRAVSAIALVALAVLFVDLGLLYRFFVPPREATHVSLSGARVHVGLTCYNDEVAIEAAVREFKASPAVSRVVVVDNNSRDGSVEAARRAGADLVVTERTPGYGACCMRALAEAAEGADVVVLCEGDMTFSASDAPKLIAYLENCDLVLGTRATQELRERDTQMDWLINPFNQLVAKLHQMRFFGTRLTDVGCTFRALRIDAYQRLAPRLSVNGSHFSPHMFIEALKLDMRVIEVPIYFRRRVGKSKGVGTNKWKAAQVATAMLLQLFRS